MISSLTGTLEQLAPTELVIMVNGVGYQVMIPLSTFETLEHRAGPATILTYLHVREDALQLYGFATEREREMFRLLITISGIGPKMALSMLSGMGVEELRQAIAERNFGALTSISGVGKKTAERICMELRDKVAPGAGSAAPPPSSQQLKTRSEALVALMSLGHTRQSAEAALRTVLAAAAGRELGVEEMVKLALRNTPR